MRNHLLTPFPEIAGEIRAHVLGLGRTGQACVQWMLKKGWKVIASDDGNSEQLRHLKRELEAQGVYVELEGHNEALTYPVDIAVVSPGMRIDHPAVRARRQEGGEVISEVELAYRFSQGILVGITGSNGKSTTTALLGAIFSTATSDSFTCGNIGLPFISVIDNTSNRSFIALELSSFQLETTCNFRPYVSILLNISPDHLDWHGNWERYIKAKSKIYLNQSPSDFIIYNFDDPILRDLVQTARSTLIPFSLRESLTMGAYFEGESLTVRLPGRPLFTFPRPLLKLRGNHNVANTLAAVTAASILNIDYEAISSTLTSFTGLPHRLERVMVHRGVEWINDSKATNPDSGRVALEAIDAPIILIAGGRPKPGGFRQLRDIVAQKVKALIVIGEAAEQLIADLGDIVPSHHCANLKEAIHFAFNLAHTGDTVLFSPLCASFDMFANFEERGNVFKQLIRETLK